MIESVKSRQSQNCRKKEGACGKTKIDCTDRTDMAGQIERLAGERVCRQGISG